MNTTTTTRADAALRTSARHGGALARPGVLAVGLSRIGFETRSYFRSTDALFFTFLFPVLILGIFVAAFEAGGDIPAGPDGPAVNVATYFLPGLLAAGVLLSGVQNLAVEIAIERSDGTLKRLGGTPLSPVSYFIGKFGQVLVTGVLQATLLLVVGGAVLGAELPTEPGRWATFAWVFLLGIATSALLGIALAAVPRSGRTATAVVVPILLVLQFISGVYLQFTQLPEWMQHLASLFPLKWMAQGMRSVFLPEEFAAQEMNGSWELGAVALVLLAWLVVGLVISRLTFRWIRRDA